MKIVIDSFRWNVVVDTGGDRSRVLMMKDGAGNEFHVMLSAEDASKIGTKLSGGGIEIPKRAKPKGIVGT